MSTVPKRLPVRVRLQIASLQMLIRFIKSAAFRLLHQRDRLSLPDHFPWILVLAQSDKFRVPPISLQT
jgi:hypothetical protein